ncbi:hypothetical protein BPTFM16_01807 [Altererythrobacter insulae]|nr:hypothetical protein BPTFM16_01807 [Altererythrobacter insulae]
MKNRGFWILAGLAMTVAALARFADFEDRIRTALRAQLDAASLLEGRYALQMPLVIVAIGIAIGIAAILLRRIPSWRSRSVELAAWLGKLALLALIVLLVVRIISLHATDRILFTPIVGPVTSNWLLDIGFATMLLLAAIMSRGAGLRNMR